MDKSRIGRPAEILLVEDNPGDVRLTQVALEEGRINNNLHVVRDGVEAMDFLHRRGEHKNAPRPDIIFLDLNIPKKDGREVLSEIKSDKNLKRLPVVVLTTSEAEEDILKSYGLNANCYVIKPVSLDQFFSVIRNLGNFWLTVVTLPS